MSFPLNYVVSKETAEIVGNNPAVKLFKRDFASIFNSQENDAKVSYAPGRVNCIGEHTDHQGGYVFPAAIDKGVFAMGRRKTSSDASKKLHITVVCHQCTERATFECTPTTTTSTANAGDSHNESQVHVLTLSPRPLPLETDAKQPTFRWAKYVHALLSLIKVERKKKKDHDDDDGGGELEIAVFSTLPVGAGVSSSAAFCISMLQLLLYLVGAAPANKSDEAAAAAARLALARTAQKAEHMVGINCGIMDQMASLFGRSSTALLVDCDPNHTAVKEYVPLPTHDIRFVLVDSHVQHELGDSYNKLRAALSQSQLAVGDWLAKQPGNETAEAAKKPFSAVEWARQELASTATDDARRSNPVELAASIADKLSSIATAHAGVSEDAATKLRYVVGETVRTTLFTDILRRLNGGSVRPSERDEELVKLGALLNATHVGLASIGVSTAQLDFLQSFLTNEQSAEGTGVKVLGARMHGGGFGGMVICAITAAKVPPGGHEQEQAAVDKKRRKSIHEEDAGGGGGPAMSQVLMERCSAAFGSYFFAEDDAFRIRAFEVNAGPGASILI